jgi:hypothetical protein
MSPSSSLISATLRTWESPLCRSRDESISGIMEAISFSVGGPSLRV